ncbi:hypothetical protein ES332_A08G194800v1 [Gossypium tomentosum]|uniref:Uncharacterized protein n=1 Tax=Gossypium tomentosum TaxID=34277 RepID=A0A5D2PGY6_GOSTO|nr:hypothetical protein ES332_A08G194800v1 [Gossypium tomentosum]
MLHASWPDVRGGERGGRIRAAHRDLGFPENPKTLGLSGPYFWTQVFVFMNWTCYNLGSDYYLLSIVCILARAKIGSYNLYHIFSITHTEIKNERVGV